MMDFMETLLVAWGQERLEPSTEVSIRSPLGHVDECGSGIGGSRCLSNVETWVAQSRAVLAVDQALRDLVGEQGAGGRVLLQLAEVRYARQPALKLADQWRVLAVSRNTYRARVDLLHVEVAARLPAIIEQLMRLVAAEAGARKRGEWLSAGVAAGKKSDERLRKVRVAQGRAVRAQLKRQAAAAKATDCRLSGENVGLTEDCGSNCA